MNLLQIWDAKPVVGNRWTLRDIVQGKPFHHPSHPLFVHFPSSLLPAAFIFDVASLIHADETLFRAALYNMAFGLGMALGAVLTGLVDYLPMIWGSRKKRIATYHLLAQVPAMSVFGASLGLHAANFNADQASVAAVVLAGLGTIGVITGNYFGGYLVYRQGMRVSVNQ